MNSSILFFIMYVVSSILSLKLDNDCVIENRQTVCRITILQTKLNGNYTKQLESILEIKSRIRYCLEKENEVKNNNDTSEQIITTTISPSVELKNPNYLHTVKIPLYKVWVYSIGAVFIISVVGFTSVALIPLLQFHYFDNITQYLVSVAIGSLIGDALLHLLPHAYTASYMDASPHRSFAPSIVAFLGFYIFFFVEQLFGIFLDGDNTKIGAGNIDSDENIVEQNLIVKKDHLFVCKENSEIDRIEMVHKSAKEESPTDKTNKKIKEIKVTRDKSSVAIMVIIGDALHNFCDGMAIGASFSCGISIGVSTSIAVFCHELPHEMGDFAVLLRVGMNTKFALFYNLVSSFLSVLGVAFSIYILQNVTSINMISAVIFAFTAGVFIYIALIDMVPHLSKKTSGKLFIIQNLGILSGATSMFCVAVYEYVI